MSEGNEIFAAYAKWIESKGVSYNKCQFTNTGAIIATDNIKRGDILIQYPLALSINKNAILQSDIGPIIKAHPELFETHVQATVLAFTIYLLRQAIIKEASPLYHYIKMIGNPDIVFNWKESEQNELQDEFLKSEALGYEKEMQVEWDSIQMILKDYPVLFPSASYDYQLFKLMYQIAITKLPCNTINEPMLLPLIDNAKRGVPNAKVIMEDPKCFKYTDESEYAAIRSLVKGNIKAFKESVKANEDTMKTEFDYIDDNSDVEEEEDKKETIPSLIIYSIKKTLKGSEIVLSYGFKSSQFLMLNYGCFHENNPYDSMKFRVRRNLDPKFDVRAVPSAMYAPDKQYILVEGKFSLMLNPDAIFESDEARMSSMMVSLKHYSFPSDLVIYIREHLVKFFLDKLILTTSPTNIAFEIEMARTAKELLLYVRSQFSSDINQDNGLLGLCKNPRLLRAVYKIERKKILLRNINLFKTIEAILVESKDNSSVLAKTYLIKREWETDDDYYINRVATQKYFRSLIKNQKHI